MKILLLEDEKLAAQKVLQLLYGYFEHELDIKWVQSVQQGLKYLRENGDPDLILSDIELLDGKVFRLYEQYEVKCPIIFATAYDQYLLDAFQTNGIAYLLKPYSDEDLKNALDKYLKLFHSEDKGNALSMAMIGELKAALKSSQREYKKRFTIKKASGIFLLKTEDIAYFTASDDLVFAMD
ncbi:MAG: LytTR family DNA-binding domain-containing protein, partial [Bacteroidota bacterium]